MLTHSFFIESSSKLLVTRTGIKAQMSKISGLWFPWPIYMFFEIAQVKIFVQGRISGTIDDRKLKKGLLTYNGENNVSKYVR